ncbi:MAG: hypothetical protein WBC82_10915 [Dehalococcoidia bacterium]
MAESDQGGVRNAPRGHFSHHVAFSGGRHPPRRYWLPCHPIIYWRLFGRQSPMLALSIGDAYLLLTTIDVVESRDIRGFPAYPRLRYISGGRYILPFLFPAQQDNSQKLTKRLEVRTIY